MGVGGLTRDSQQTKSAGVSKRNKRRITTTTVTITTTTVTMKTTTTTTSKKFSQDFQIINLDFTFFRTGTY